MNGQVEVNALAALEWGNGSECNIVTLVPLDFEKVTHPESRGFHSMGIGDG